MRDFAAWLAFQAPHLFSVTIAVVVGAIVVGILFLAFIGLTFLIRTRSVIGRVAAARTRAEIEEEYRKGDMLSVIHKCRNALHEYPNDLELRWHLALALYADEQYEKSKEHFEYVGSDPRFEAEALPFLKKLETKDDTAGTRH